MEERIEGEDFRSPSAQLRISPSGQVEILSTHDQILGGPHAQTYFGCRFPADPEYAPLIAADALIVGRRLAREGVIGRARRRLRRRPGRWRLGVVRARDQPPLRRHDAPVHGALDAHGRRLRPARGRVPEPARRPEALRRHRRPRLGTYAALTPDDLLDLVAERHLGWDAERETGIALHMVSALAVAGRVGLTAIGDTPPEARALYHELKQALDSVAERAAGTRAAEPAPTK